MWEIEYTNRFKRSFKRCIKRGLNVEVFATAVEILVEILRQTGTLPPEYRPHKLSGKYTGYWECHLQPDWLLVWLPREEELILTFIDTSTHSDLFG